MLISKIDNEGVEEGSIQEGHSHDYQAANELFELMEREQEFNNNSEDLSRRDLVILYKNIDIGSKLMSNANEYNRVRKPNQYVETVIYAEDPESDDSELGEIYSKGDIPQLFSINKERIELLNNRPSFEKTLCQKLGDLEIQSSRFSLQYDKYFVLQDPFIKQQLNNLNLKSTENLVEPFFPASLLDYMCCKKLEDFYIDNIICYVKNTIEQLKRISNGDYLTERAKELWRKVENIQNHQNTKILATSTSIPLHLETKTSGHISSWDDIVHSEVDVRSLSKILEKKIVLKIPKFICGTYKLFSKLYADNFIISCQRENMKSVVQDSKSRVDLVLQLKRSESDQLISNIGSIKILQAAPTIHQEPDSREPLPLSYIEAEEEKEVCTEKRVRIVEILDNNDSTTTSSDYDNQISKDKDVENEGTLDSFDCSFIDDKDNSSYKCRSYQESNGSSYALRDILDKRESLITKTLNIISSDKLEILEVKKLLSEETDEHLFSHANEQTSKQKSPTRFRIKSPYHNKSYALDEKKRKKLLEIREKRERKKMAMRERCSKSKDCGRSATMPQAANSVTKLSISNKSFYNSIYGKNLPLEKKPFKSKSKCIKKDAIPEISLNDSEDEYEKSIETSDKNSNKYINKSYYLDETETEMMFLTAKQQSNSISKDLESASTSAASNDFKANLTLLTQFIAPSESDLGSNTEAKFTLMTKEVLETQENIKGHSSLDVIENQNSINIVPTCSPKDRQLNDDKDLKKISALDCRESINQIYDLMKQFTNNDLPNANVFKGDNKSSKKDKLVVIAAAGCSTIQDSDSGTSLKHYQTSSVPSCFSLDKVNVEDTPQKTNPNKKPERPTTVVPKVIIHSRLQSPTSDKVKKEKRVTINPPIKVSENPLRAISQILHEFENVQKVRQKPIEPKIPKSLPSTDIKSGSRQIPFVRNSRVDQNRDADVERLKRLSPKQRSPRTIQTNSLKTPQYQITVGDKREKVFPKKLTDMMDQAKEARGEAVRGPCKFPSRLNALAQPKRSYVQAHSEEHHTKYGRSIMANSLQRLATNSFSAQRSLSSASPKNRFKRLDTTSDVKQPPPVPSLAVRRPVNHSVHKTTESLMVASPYKHNVPNSPENLNRMVAVESYVNSHYGRTPVGTSMHRAIKSQDPLFQIDIDRGTETPNDSQKIDSRFSMIEAKPGLAVLSEGVESSLNISSNDTEELMNNDSISKEDKGISINSDYQIDIFQDQNIRTAVNESQYPKTKDICVVNTEVITKQNKQPANSCTELNKLENALYRRLSVGAFQKMSRIKNLTLTPKKSMGQIFALQSGDVGSVGKKTALKILKFNKTESPCDVKSLSVLSQTCIDWRLASFPMQITTVSCCFSNNEKRLCTSNFKTISFDDLIPDNINNDRGHLNSNKSHEVMLMMKYTSGCTKTTKREQIVQVNLLRDQNVSYVEDIKMKSNANVEIKSVGISSNDFMSLSSHNAEHTKEVKHIAINTKPDEQSDIDYTTSLDILVGLLNEIQKIISCQSEIASPDNENLQSKGLETMLNNASTMETSTVDSVHISSSMPSEDNLKQLKSSSSICNNLSKYEYITEDMQNSNKKHTIADLKPLSVDKEVNVDLFCKYVNNFTDVPSDFLPVTLNHSTNVTNSLIGILSEPSSQSIFSFADYQAYAMSSFRSSQIIQQPKLQKPDESHQSLVAHNDMKKEEFNQNSCPPGDISNNVITHKCAFNKRLSTLNNCHESEEFEPTLKMKRDILVTFYSILVFTVFAALSFPEIINHL